VLLLYEEIMADPNPVPPKGPAVPSDEDETGAPLKGETEDQTRVREAIGEGLRKFYDSVADEPIPAEWLALVGAKPDDETTK
jgi:hypothetical protein